MLIIVAFVLLLLLPSPWQLWDWKTSVNHDTIEPRGLDLYAEACARASVVELFFWNRTVRNRRKQVGAGTLIGRTATVVSPCRPEGQVRLDGEIWAARCAAGAASQDSVRVVGRDRLTLIVEPISDPTGSSGREDESTSPQ